MGRKGVISGSKDVLRDVFKSGIKGKRINKVVSILIYNIAHITDHSGLQISTSTNQILTSIKDL
jgi:hypothetical protein